MEIDTDKITRIEIIDGVKREFSKWDCEIELSVQDGGRTLKVFVDERCSVDHFEVIHDICKNLEPGQTFVWKCSECGWTMW